VRQFQPSAGHRTPTPTLKATNWGGQLIDTNDHPIVAPVWGFCTRQAVAIEFGDVPDHDRSATTTFPWELGELGEEH